MFWNVAGIEIAVPWGPADLKGLLRTALKSDNPSLVITHAFGYGAEEEVPDEDYEIPLGQAAVKREGSDVTIVACSMMVVAALEAAGTLAGEGIEAEVIDLRTLVPLDREGILESVRKTSKVVVLHEATRACGVGAEVSALIAERAWEDLDGPVVRVSTPDVPIPFSPTLEQAVLPQVDDVKEACRELLEY